MRGPYNDRRSEYEKALEWRMSGHGYRSVADEVNVPWETVRGWVQHIPADRHAAYEKATARNKMKCSPMGRVRFV